MLWPLVLTLLIPGGVSAQEEQHSLAQNQLGINVLHTPIVYLVSASMSEDVTYVPIHLSYARSFTKNLGLSMLAFYRRDHDEDFETNELGLAAGPRLSFDRLKGWFVEWKLGVGRASGVDYYSNDYTRWDFVIQPELGYTRTIGTGFSITAGIGLQTLIEVSETPSRAGSWDWNDMGQLSHYYLPVANLTLAMTF